MRKMLSSNLGRLGVRQPTVDVLCTLKLKKGSWIAFVESGLSSILGVFKTLEVKRSLRERVREKQRQIPRHSQFILFVSK